KVWYLTNDKLFPPGVQPACALKEGFLLFGSSPEALLSFRMYKANAGQRKETPLFRLSAQELARLLQQRQEPIIASLKTRHRLSDEEAKQHVTSAIALLELFEQVTLSHHGHAGQASWSLRITAASSS